MSYGDCGSPFSPIYFLTYMIVCKWTMINLFISMIINNFSYCANRENEGSVTDADLECLVDTWIEHFDSEGTSFVRLSQVYQMMWFLGEPLGFFGDDGNTLRYLCVREDLRLLIQQEMARKKKIENAVALQEKGEAGKDTMNFLSDVGAEERGSFLMRTFHNMHNAELRIKDEMTQELKQVRKEWDAYEVALIERKAKILERASKRKAQREKIEKLNARKEADDSEDGEGSDCFVAYDPQGGSESEEEGRVAAGKNFGSEWEAIEAGAWVSGGNMGQKNKGPKKAKVKKVGFASLSRGLEGKLHPLRNMLPFRTWPHSSSAQISHSAILMETQVKREKVTDAYMVEDDGEGGFAAADLVHAPSPASPPRTVRLFSSEPAALLWRCTSFTPTLPPHSLTRRP